MQTDQLLYNLSRRGIEWDLLPWLRRHAIPVMAYSPIEQARLLDDQDLCRLAKQWNLTPSQVALGWLLAKPDVIVIPKTSRRDRLRENFAALLHPLTHEQISKLDRLFPPPSPAAPLDML